MEVAFDYCSTSKLSVEYISRNVRDSVVGKFTLFNRSSISNFP